MRVADGIAPAYNVQTAVDAEHALIVTHAVTLDAADNRQLEPMAQAARKALAAEQLNIVADAGYSNGAQAARMEAEGLVPHVPANRAVNNQGDGTLFDRNLFVYDEKSDSFTCPANQMLARKQLQRHKTRVIYAADSAVCGACPLKSRCTQVAATVPASALARRRAQPNARPRHAGDHASETFHRRTSLRRPQVPHLRPPPPAAARHPRRSDRNRNRRHGLQPQTHLQPARRVETNTATQTRLIPQPPKTRTLPKGSVPSKLKPARSVTDSNLGLFVCRWQSRA